MLPDNIRINDILFKNGLRFESVDFFTFVRESLVQRERLKFEFTKNLSAALELITHVSKRLGFTRKDIANLTLEDILNSKNMNKEMITMIWKNKISINIRKKNISTYLLLPPIIFSEKDFKIISHYVAKPNYITNDTITANLFHLSTNKISDLSNCIIMIENADPGYDWIFAKNPSGLITKYGGVASHMAIRCAELGLPAAIGCGEIIFERLYHAKKIMLDCKNQQIIVLQHEREDDYVEEKKILKSLGYIK
jgi:phosphoenolpyruvate-protein kinase (PTS system EI component)